MMSIKLPECRMLKENVVFIQTQLMSALSNSGTVQQTSAPPMNMNLFCQHWTNNLKQVYMNRRQKETENTIIDHKLNFYKNAFTG